MYGSGSYGQSAYASIVSGITLISITDSATGEVVSTLILLDQFDSVSGSSSLSFPYAIQVRRDSATSSSTISELLDITDFIVELDGREDIEINLEGIYDMEELLDGLEDIEITLEGE